MKSTQQLLKERYDIFVKYLEKKCEGIYTIVGREEAQRKSALWQKYLKARQEEINKKIAFNDEILASVNEKN